MRQLVTIAATALTLSALSLATPSFAANNGYGGSNQNGQYQNNQNNDDHGYQGDRNRNADKSFNFDRQERNFDRWERGWGNQGFNQFRHQRPLSYSQLTRRLQAQGYYGVRGLRKSNFGLGWRAFAFTGRGRPVMLQINPYSGRVLNVRYV